MGRVAPSLCLGHVEQAAVKMGFSLLRGDGQERLLQYEGLRVRIRHLNDGLVIDGLFPRSDKLAEFLLEADDEDWWTGLANGTIVRRLVAKQDAVAIHAIDQLKSLTALLGTEAALDRDLIRPLGNRLWLRPVPAAWTELGRVLLPQTRAVAARGTLLSVWSWLATFVAPAVRYAICSETLLTSPEKGGLLLRNTGATNGVCLLVNTGCLPSDVWRHYYLNELLPDLALADAAAGARVVFLCAPGVSLSDDVPVVDVPDFAAGSNALVPDSGLRRVLRRNGALQSGEVDSFIEKARRSTNAGPTHGVSTVHAPVILSAIDQFQRWSAKVIEGLAGVMGHGEIKRKLARSIALWMAQGESADPLVLAFAGPSGVGKNMIAHALAGILAGPEFMELPRATYVTINMGVPGDQKQWSLTGVGAGHVGAERKGLLEASCELPGYVVTFDEVDKSVAGLADPQGFLVNLFENNGFRNGHGMWVSLAKGILILTMNCGTNAEDERFKPIGFQEADTLNARQKWVAGRYRQYYETQIIAPLRGRVQHVFFFGELTADELFDLAVRELKRRHAADAAAGLPWRSFSPEKTAEELTASLDPSQGARELSRAITRFHEHLLDALLNEPGTRDQNKG